MSRLPHVVVCASLSVLCLGCGKPPAPPSTSPSSPSQQSMSSDAEFEQMIAAQKKTPVVTTPADGGWVTFEFPKENFTVELPAAPEFDDVWSNETQTIYAVKGGGYSAGVVVGPITEPTAEAELEEKIRKAPILYKGSTSQKLTHAGMPGVEFRYPPVGKQGVGIWRYFYRDGKEISLQFSLLSGGDENATAADRERFFNSLKLK